MNYSLRLALALLLVQSASAQQGTISPPPTAPTPQRQTLSTTRPGTPLVAGQPGVVVSNLIEIHLPGRYYLTTPIDRGVRIYSSDVTLDLCGFTIDFGQPGNTPEVAISSGLNNAVRVCNGNVLGHGIALLGPSSVVSDCMVEGAPGLGIDVPQGRVERCVVDGTGEGGVPNLKTGQGVRAALIEDCIAQNCWLSGIMVSDAPPLVIRYFPESPGTVRRCYGQCVGGDEIFEGAGDLSGISANKSAIEDSIGISSPLHGWGGSWNVPTSGIKGATVINCRGFSALSVGIHANTVQNSFGARTSVGNHVSGFGISALSVSECVGKAQGTGEDLVGISCYQAMNSVGVGTTHGILGFGNVTFCQSTRPGGGAAIKSVVVTGTTTLEGGTVVPIEPGQREGYPGPPAPPVQKFFGTL